MAADRTDWTQLFPLYDLGLSGNHLLAAITACTALSFCLIGYDNGETEQGWRWIGDDTDDAFSLGIMGGIIETEAFNKAFNYPEPALIGNIVAVYE